MALGYMKKIRLAAECAGVHEEQIRFLLERVKERKAGMAAASIEREALTLAGQDLAELNARGADVSFMSHVSLLHQIVSYYMS